MEFTCEAAGRTFRLRTFTHRDVIKITGRMGVLPVSPETARKAEETPEELLKRFNPQQQASLLEVNERLLEMCSREPKLVLGEGPAPEGQILIVDLPDEAFGALIGRLYEVSGFSKAAVEEVRPTSAIAGS